jgi:hypothetical protein
MKALLAALALSSVATCAVAQNYSADERRTIDRRAVQAVIWGMPAVNYVSDVSGDGPRNQRRL